MNNNQPRHKTEKTSIWFDDFPLDYVNQKANDALNANLGIEILEAGDGFLKGRMPVDHRTRQPAGVLHGGASVAFAETLASWAGAYAVDPSRFHVVGLEINANHIRPVSSGFVYGVAEPVTTGKTIHVWSVSITDERGKLVCVSRVTLAVLPKPSEY